MSESATKNIGHVLPVTGSEEPQLVGSAEATGPLIKVSAGCVGRPYLWGLGAFGQSGVERVLEILRTEFRVAMQQCGVRAVKELTAAFVRRAT